MSYKYRPMLRPASFATLPEGVKWEFVERPVYITRRPDLPLSQYTHGVISVDRKLTKDEREHFALWEEP